MILALLGSALALDCAEILHMQDAGVPTSDIVAAVDAAPWSVDQDLRRCLRTSGGSAELVAALSRLPALRSSWTTPIEGSWTPGSSTRVTVDLECGVLRVQGTDGAVVTASGRTEGRGVLRATAASDGIQLAVVDAEHAFGPEAAALPRMTPAPRVRHAEQPCGELTLAVPPSTDLEVRSTRADLLVRSVEGSLTLTTHFGDMDLVGDTAELVLKTTGGTIRADTAARFADVQTVSGLVELGVGPEGRAQVTSISGPVWVWGGPARRVTIDTVSGDVRLNLTAAPQGHLQVTTHKGRVEAYVPGGEVEMDSLDGHVSGPPRLVRPDGPSTRLGVPGGTPPRFSSLDTLSPSTRGLWGRDRPERWWFGTGGVVSNTQLAPTREFTFQARSFSGDILVRDASSWPGPTGPVIARLDGAADRLEACARDQLARHPDAPGHAVAHLEIDGTGTVSNLTAPATATDPAAVADGAISACVVRALGRLTFPPGGDVEVRWPVRFRVVPPAGEAPESMVEAPR